MASPMDRLLDQVDWACAKCGVSMKTGCHCWDRTTAEEKRALATSVRQQFRLLLRRQYPQIWQAMRPSAQQSLPNYVYNAVTAGLSALDRPWPRGSALTPTDWETLAWDIRQHWHCYILSTCADLYGHFPLVLWQQVMTDLEALAVAQAEECLVKEE